MLICIECNYMGSSIGNESCLCPRCYKQYRVAKMLNLRQLATSARTWMPTMPAVAEQRKQQYTMLQQHLANREAYKNEQSNQIE